MTREELKDKIETANELLRGYILNGEEIPEELKSTIQDLKEKLKMRQVCVWTGILHTKQQVPEMVNFIKEATGCNVEYLETVITLPDRDSNGLPVKDTGGRSDVLLAVDEKDVKKFAIPRLELGIRWWEDVLDNGGYDIYPQEVLDRYPYTWK